MDGISGSFHILDDKVYHRYDTDSHRTCHRDPINRQTDTYTWPDLHSDMK